MISTSTLLENWKKLWNMKVTIIAIVIGVFGTVTKGLLKGLEDMEDEWRPSKRQHYWERPEYWEESERLEGTCCHSNSSERPSDVADVKNSKNNNNNNKYVPLEPLILMRKLLIHDRIVRVGYTKKEMKRLFSQ